MNQELSMANEVIRSVCYFTNNLDNKVVTRVKELVARLTEQGFEVQTPRICSPVSDPRELERRVVDRTILLAVGSIPFDQVLDRLPHFYGTGDVSFNTDLTSAQIDTTHTKPLFEIIKNKPGQTFDFAYVFNNRSSSPYYPSAAYERDGFSVGLQPTNLAEGCSTLNEWLGIMKRTWVKIHELFASDSEFLGIDSSIAPVFEGKGSLINFIRRLGMSFDQSVTTDTYLTITDFLTKNNPKPVGLCGLMFPCLEDFELAEEYEAGNFSIERNVFLSLHSGLGIDTYPMGIDEDPQRVADILRLIQGLSNKYKKPLSIRFVSDGKATIGEKTDFQNQYLKDVIVQKL